MCITSDSQLIDEEFLNTHQAYTLNAVASDRPANWDAFVSLVSESKSFHSPEHRTLPGFVVSMLHAWPGLGRNKHAEERPKACWDTF